VAGIFTKSILKLLQQYPSAFALRDADLGQLSQTLIADSYGHNKRDVCSRVNQGSSFVDR